MNLETDNVTVTIPRSWVRCVQSPVMTLVVVLSGVSITFVPLSLFQLGKLEFSIWNPLVLLCFTVTYFVPLFYMSLAGQVIPQLSKMSLDAATSSFDSASDGPVGSS